MTLEDHDETGRRGFMFARYKNGNVKFRRKDASLLPDQFPNTEMDQSQLPPAIQKNWFQDTFELGLGGVNQRHHPHRLAMGNKVDTSIPGVLRSARQVRTTALDTSETAPDKFYPSGFALAQGIVDLNPVLWSMVGRDVYTWDTTSSAWDFSSEPQNVDVIYKNGLQFGANVIAPAWYAGSDANEIPKPYIYKEPATATWILSTLAQGRFKYVAKGRNSSDNEVVYGGNNISDTALNLSGAHNDSTTTIVCSADPTAIIAVNDIITLGAAGVHERMLVTAVTNPNLTVIRGYGDTPAAHSDTDDIFLYLPHVVRVSSDISNTGSWGGEIAVGQQLQPITGVLFDADNDVLIVTKTDGIYDVDSSGNVHNLTPLFRQAGHVGNFMGVFSWNNHILLPMGSGGLLDFDYATLDIKDVSLRVEAPEETTHHGVVLAMAGEPTSFFAIVKDLTAETLYFMQAHEITAGGETRFRWQVLGKLGAGATITNNHTSLMVDTSRTGRRRVWMGFTEASVNELPRFYPFGNLSDDSDDGYSNDSDVQGESVAWDGGFPRMLKRLEEVEIESRNLGVGGREISLEYQLERGGTWFSLGTVNESPFQSVKFPSGLSAFILELRCTLTQTSITTKPVDLLSWRVVAQLRPESLPTYEITVHLADNQLTLNGAIQSKSRGDEEQLEEWNRSAAEVLFYKPGAKEFV
jgi:hypothetical protein